MLVKARKKLWGDRYGNPLELYASKPLLSKLANPYMMRVQRESDSAQADRAYSDGNVVLVSGGASQSPANFLGSGNARMTRWYSQVYSDRFLSGSNINVFAARSGIFESINGLPAIFAGRSNSTLYADSNTAAASFQLKNSTIFIIGSALRDGSVNRGILQDVGTNIIRVEGATVTGSSGKGFFLGLGLTGSASFSTPIADIHCLGIICRELTFELWRNRGISPLAPTTGSNSITYDSADLVQLKAFTRNSSGANGYQQAIAVFATAFDTATMAAAMQDLCDEFGIA